ncbi:MAG: hypothetical protein AAGK05_11575, partial [Pseudomonadota bacterium]
PPHFFKDLLVLVLENVGGTRKEPKELSIKTTQQSSIHIQISIHVRAYMYKIHRIIRRTAVF